MRDVLDDLVAVWRAGGSAGLATVVRTFRSAPRPAGASMMVAPDGSVWVTLALGNQLARFDPATEEWSIYPLSEGFYPHTLRIDDTGRVWRM